MKRVIHERYLTSRIKISALMLASILVLVFPLMTHATSIGTLTVYAGNGTAGYNGGGVATSYELYRPSGVAVDSTNGILYIADYAENRIRKVDFATHTLSDFAGNGTPGHVDNTSPLSAELYGPFAIAVDPSNGDVYFTETINNDVRKVSFSTGAVTTVAGTGTLGFGGDGGAAISAYLYQPQGIAVDSSHNVYIADTYNHRIRVVTASTGNISTIAGNGTCGFYGDGSTATGAEICTPMGIALDPSGNLYIADYGNARIRTVTSPLTPGNITTIAGNGTPGNSLAPPASQSTTYPTTVSIVALNVAVDGSYNVWIGSGPAILELSSGTLTRVIGTGTEGFSGIPGAAENAVFGGGPDGLAIDAAGDVFLADANNSRVLSVLNGSCLGIYRIAPYGAPVAGWYEGFTVETSAPTSLSVGEGISITGNSRSDFNNSPWYIDTVVDSTHFTVLYSVTRGPGTGGCVTLIYP